MNYPNISIPLKISLVLAVFLFISCSKQVYVTEVRPSAVRIDKTAVVVDPAISAIIAPYKIRLDSTMHKIIGISETELVKNKPNSSMGNWFADILYAEAVKINPEVDFAVQNYGGLRIPSLPQGNITVGKIYELMPFDNTLYIMHLSGEITKKLLDRIADYGGWPISKNITFTAEYGEARRVFIKGKPFDINTYYWVAIPDYVANGGDNCSFLVGQEAQDTGLFIRDLVIRHLEERYKAGEIIKADLEERIKE